MTVPRVGEKNLQNAAAREISTILYQRSRIAAPSAMRITRMYSLIWIEIVLLAVVNVPSFHKIAHEQVRI